MLEVKVLKDRAIKLFESTKKEMAKYEEERKQLYYYCKNANNVNLEEEARIATIEKVKGYITRFGGTVTEVEDWGKKRLAYEIQKSKEAFYYFVKFESNSECPNEVEARVRLMENVVRYLVVKQEA